MSVISHDEIRVVATIPMGAASMALTCTASRELEADLRRPSTTTTSWQADVEHATSTGSVAFLRRERNPFA